ncbi:hypothetical protein BayCH28_20880 [Mycolicibacterium sp. CH28]|nr:hypothetical protein BayCH28_20880 [Mycolicibacterium sp. CH28]
MRIPASGCAAVPLLKKTLNSESMPPPTPICAAFGVLATEAAGVAAARSVLVSAAGTGVFT